MNMEMDNPDALKARRQLAAISRSVLDGELSIVEAVREMYALRYLTGQPEDGSFLFLRAIESDTDGFPLGAVGERYDAEYLRRLDDELQVYLSDIREDFIRFCNHITFSQMLKSYG